MCNRTAQVAVIRVFAVAECQARVALSEAVLHAEVEANKKVFSHLQSRYFIEGLSVGKPFLYVSLA
jgi:hypothetical protein